MPDDGAKCPWCFGKSENVEDGQSKFQTWMIEMPKDTKPLWIKGTWCGETTQLTNSDQLLATKQGHKARNVDNCSEKSPTDPHCGDSWGARKPYRTAASTENDLNMNGTDPISTLVCTEIRVEHGYNPTDEEVP